MLVSYDDTQSYFKKRATIISYILITTNIQS